MKLFRVGIALVNGELHQWLVGAVDDIDARLLAVDVALRSGLTPAPNVSMSAFAQLLTVVEVPIRQGLLFKF